MKKTIGVVFGGKSVEHEISVLSTMQVIKAIDTSLFNYILIYMDKNNDFFVGKGFDDINTFKLNNFKRQRVFFKKNKTNRVVLTSSKKFLRRSYRRPIDCILSIVHGLGVEDGSLAAFFKILNLPYTASDVLAASVGQDKVIMKQVFKSSNIPTIPFTYFTDHEWINKRKTCLQKIKRLGFPVIIKPSRLGSSIGIKIAKDIDALKVALEEAFNYDNRVVVEKALTNFREFNCATLGGYLDLVYSEIEEVITASDFLTFDDKYISGKENIPKRIIPAEIEGNLKQNIKDLCYSINKVLLNKGVSRVDFLYCLERKKLYVNELNTIPGSLSFYLFDAVDIDFKSLITKLIENAIKDHYVQSLKLSSFNTNVLAMNNLLKGKK